MENGKFFEFLLHIALVMCAIMLSVSALLNFDNPERAQVSILWLWVFLWLNRRRDDGSGVF